MSKEIRPRLKGQIKKAYKNLIKDESRILVIGDLHEPFCLDGYLQFCKDTYAKHNLNKVIFIGDVIDNHYASFHEVSNEAKGGKYELDDAVKKLSRWYKAFPNADVTLGNHDRIIVRKAQTSNIPSKWIKEYKEVLETPNWNFVTDVYYDGVRYVHGDKSGKPRMAAKRDMVSTVSGHYHTDFYCEWLFGKTRAIFALACGCGIDSKSYAMGYMQGGKKEAIGCGVVVGGHTAFNVKMEL